MQRDNQPMVRVLFVCHANLCRSPMAQAILLDLVHRSGLESEIEVDSAGTSPHFEGQPYHPEAVRVCAEHGIPASGQSRPVEYSDLQNFDYIIAMDETNHADLLSLDQSGKHRGKIHKLRNFNTPDMKGDHNIPDPVGLGPEAFDHTFHLVMDAVMNFLKHLRSSQKRVAGL